MKKMRSYTNLTKIFLNQQNIAKKTWGGMKEIIAKTRNTESRVIVIEKKEITEIKGIVANEYSIK